MISKTLEAWPESPEQLLEDLDRFVHLSTKFANKYELSLTLFLFPLEASEMEAVLTAADRLDAATTLLAAKINRWD
jgi:hypothetical protein